MSASKKAHNDSHYTGCRITLEIDLHASDTAVSYLLNEWRKMDRSLVLSPASLLSTPKKGPERFFLLDINKTTGQFAPEGKRLFLLDPGPDL